MLHHVIKLFEHIVERIYMKIVDIDVSTPLIVFVVVC